MKLYCKFLPVHTIVLLTNLGNLHESKLLYDSNDNNNDDDSNNDDDNENFLVNYLHDMYSYKSHCLKGNLQLAT